MSVNINVSHSPSVLIFNLNKIEIWGHQSCLIEILNLDYGTSSHGEITGTQLLPDRPKNTNENYETIFSLLDIWP